MLRKVYIDSRYKTSSSTSNTDFTFELKQNLDLPDSTTCWIDDVSIPHTWYTVENFNSNLYIRVVATGNIDKRINLTQKNYTGSTLATELQTQLNNAFTESFTVTYFSPTGRLNISISTNNFIIYTETELENNTMTWTGTGSDSYVNYKNLANDLLRHSDAMSATDEFTTNFIDLLNVHSIYICSSNLGSFQTLGPRGNTDILKKVPVSSNYGYLILDSVVSTIDGIDVSKQGIKTLHFRITDVRGNIIPLHGSHVSFSLIFKSEG